MALLSGESIIYCIVNILQVFARNMLKKFYLNKKMFCSLMGSHIRIDEQWTNGIQLKGI